MNRLSALLLLMMINAPLLSQAADFNKAKQTRYALITLTKYCADVDTVSDSQQPRVFAQVSSGLGPSAGWAKFESNAAWSKAGKPRPIALVWYDDRKVVRVVITGDDGESYADYCYRPDGSLAQLRSVPAPETNCDVSLFHCQFTVRGGIRVYSPKGMFDSSPAQATRKEPIPANQARGLDFYDYLFLRPLKPEKISVVFAPTDWPEYLSVWDLPFNQLLYVSAKATK